MSADEVQDEVSAGKSAGRATRIALGIAGTIVLGAIGSGLWEIIFRPGLGRFSNFVTSISIKAQNAAYTTAALDPTQVPSLILLLFLVQIPALIGMWFLFRGFVRPIIDAKVQASIKKIERETAGQRDANKKRRIKMQRRIRIIAALGALYSFLFFGFFFYSFSIENKAVVLWRTFHQNLEICAPYITPSEVASINANC